MKFKFLFAWYDFWIGWYWDAQKGRLYVCPVPMFGFYLKFKRYIVHEENPDGYVIYWRNMRGQITRERVAALRFSASQIRKMHLNEELVPRFAYTKVVVTEA